MLKNLLNFDPIVYLEIDVNAYSSREVEKIRGELFSMIGEYVLLALANEIPNQTLQSLNKETDGAKILDILKLTIPNFEDRMLSCVEQFKNEYMAASKSGGAHA